MKIAVIGGCGFVGSSLIRAFKETSADFQITVMDNLSRRGSELNLAALRRMGVTFVHGDTRSASDVALIPDADWLIDCAANPSVLAGVDGRVSSEQLVEHNLKGTLSLLELCRTRKMGLIFLSTSRVYSVEALNKLPLAANGPRWTPTGSPAVTGFTESGVGESFSTKSPISLYGATKLASELLALEYANAFSFPVRINRCGVIAGPGQFGKADQGFLSYWIYQYLLDRPLAYIGYGGHGLQVRDVLHPADLASLILLQMRDRNTAASVTNVGGGRERSISLAELSARCDRALGRAKTIASDLTGRLFDVPYYVTDSSLAERTWKWRPAVSLDKIFDETLGWAKENLGAIKESW